MEEKRKHIRLAWQAKLNALKTAPPHELVCEGVVKNLSRSGMAFLSEDPIQRGLVYDFKIDLMGYPLHFKGRAVHVHNMESYSLYGVRIESIPLLDRIRFNQFLSGHSPSIKLKYLIYSLLLGAGVGLVVSYVFGLSTPAAMGFAFATTLIHFAFPPF